MTSELSTLSPELQDVDGLSNNLSMSAKNDNGEIACAYGRKLIKNWEEEKCKRVQTYSLYVLTALASASSFLFPVWGRLIIVVTVLVLQICVVNYFNKQIRYISDSKEKDIKKLRMESEQKSYYRILSRESSALATAIVEVINTKNLDSFYTKFVSSVKALLLASMCVECNNITIQMYRYNKEESTISRIEVDNYFTFLESPKKFPDRPVSKRHSKKEKYYIHCVKDDSKSTFFLKDNAEILTKLKDLPEHCRSQYTQYYSAKKEINGYIYLIEIISFGGVNLSNNGGDELSSNVMEPLFDMMSLIQFV